MPSKNTYIITNTPTEMLAQISTNNIKCITGISCCICNIICIIFVSMIEKEKRNATYCVNKWYKLCWKDR